MRFDRVMVRLYAVTDRAWVGRQTLSEQIEDALRGGVTLVQLREKNLSKEKFVAEAKAVLALCRQYGVPLIINDRLDVALASGADGVHVGIEDAPVSEIRRQAGPDFIIGATAIVAIVLLSMLSTHFQLKHILRPVNALTDAARRIEAGDYSQGVGYDGKNEFTSVCAAFEHMQRHLLLEREKNAAYEKARTDLVAGISHDLRTPLTSVKGYLKGLRDGVANTPEKQRQYLDIAYRKACDMDVLLQRLFYFSKLETGNLPLSPVAADLWRFVEGFVRDSAGELEQRGGAIRLKGVPTPHPVRIDTEQMYRVLTNLTENALRYAGSEALVLTLTLWRERDRERLRFADNGRGVSDEDLPHLFEQFWRGDQSRGGQSGEGSGLGLYIVKYIVEAHGGTITARNDGGLVFELALPCEEDSIHA